MDTSKEYINLCEKAVKVQELWKPTKGDVYYNTIKMTGENSCTVLIVAHNYFNPDKYGKSMRVWLPRQDQLQGMVKAGNTTDAELLNRINYKMKGSDFNIYDYAWSMEQLWLAFVMKEKYQKIWTGSEWRQDT